MKKTIIFMILTFAVVIGLYADTEPTGEFDLQFAGIGKLHYKVFNSLGDCLEYLYNLHSEAGIVLKLVSVANNNTVLDNRVIKQTLALKSTACVTFTDGTMIVNYLDKTTSEWTTIFLALFD